MTDDQITKAFAGTNFGEHPNHKGIIMDTLLKLSIGFGTGHTAKCVCAELGLLTKKEKPSAKGLAFMRVNFDLIKPKTA
jgi:hypothetical protein